MVGGAGFMAEVGHLLRQNISISAESQLGREQKTMREAEQQPIRVGAGHGHGCGRPTS